MNIVDIKEFHSVPKRSSARPGLIVNHLQLKGGNIYAVIGKSGAGKSVFNSLLMGYPAFYQHPLRRLFIKKNVHICKVRLYLPQLLPEGRGYEMKTREYIREAVRALAATCNITNFSPEKDVDMDVFKDIKKNLGEESLSKLSGGERRRVELAARLSILRKLKANIPVLLVLDEPTTGLDWAAEKEYLEKLKELKTNNNLVIIVTTHALQRLDDQLFDKVICVRKRESSADSPIDKCEVSTAMDIKRLLIELHQDKECKGKTTGECWQFFLNAPREKQDFFIKQVSCHTEV